MDHLSGFKDAAYVLCAHLFADAATSQSSRKRSGSGESFRALLEDVTSILGDKRTVRQARRLAIVDHYSRDMLVWRNHRTPSEPHQELIPWMGLFRPLERTLWHLFIAYPEDADLLRI